jgi:hypothetical protein
MDLFRGRPSVAKQLEALASTKVEELPRDSIVEWPKVVLRKMEKGGMARKRKVGHGKSGGVCQG